MIIGAFWVQGFFWGGGTSFGTHLISVPAMTKSSSASFAGLSFQLLFFSTVYSEAGINGTELRDSFLLKIGQRAAPRTAHFTLFFPQKKCGQHDVYSFSETCKFRRSNFYCTFSLWNTANIIVCEFNSKFRLKIFLADEKNKTKQDLRLPTKNSKMRASLQEFILLN